MEIIRKESELLFHVKLHLLRFLCIAHKLWLAKYVFSMIFQRLHRKSGNFGRKVSAPTVIHFFEPFSLLISIKELNEHCSLMSWLHVDNSLTKNHQVLSKIWSYENSVLILSNIYFPEIQPWLMFWFSLILGQVNVKLIARVVSDVNFLNQCDSHQISHIEWDIKSFGKHH